MGPGEVDKDLHSEVQQECSSKYGAVKQCLVFEVGTTALVVHGELILAHHLPCRACLQVTGASVPASEAVRIFVQFKDTDSSQRGTSSSSTTPAGLHANNLLVADCDCAAVAADTTAVQGLGARYFGGKPVKAAFFSEQRFKALDLAPKPGE